jgi:hypothetical protein
MTIAKMELLKILIDLGCTVLITILLIYFAYKLINKFGVPFIKSQQEVAKAMGHQAQSMADMQSTVHDFVAGDNSDHREILLSLQVVGKELKTLSDEVKGFKHGDEC